MSDETLRRSADELDRDVREPENVTAVPSVVEALVRVMDDVGAVERKGRMDHGERYADALPESDDVLAAVQPAFVAHGVLAVPTVLDVTYRDKTTRSGGAQVWVSMKVEWTFYGPAGDSVSAVVVGEAADTSDKASNKAQTASQKVALAQVLSIPYSPQVLSIPYSQIDPDDDRDEAGAPGAAPTRRPQRPNRSRGTQENANEGGFRGDLPGVPSSTDDVETAWGAASEAAMVEANRQQDRLDALPASLAARVCGRMASKADGFPVRDVVSLPPAWLGQWERVLTTAEASVPNWNPEHLDDADPEQHRG